MNNFEWSHFVGGYENEPIEVWRLSIQDKHFNEWDLKAGTYINDWDLNITAFYDKELDNTDYPFATDLLSVYSPRRRSLMEDLRINEIQYLPLRIKRQDGEKEVYGYSIANYLRVIDCLNREKSVYQVWTKDNLLYWEKRTNMIGTFRDVTNAVLDFDKIGDAKIFRLWGWETMVVLREDVKQAIEEAGITGCEFYKIEVV
jgi:hypothetical protein